jgi:hypothetical protein
VSIERMRELDLAVQKFWTQLREQLSRRAFASANGMGASGIAAATILGALSWGVIGFSMGGPMGALLGMEVGRRFKLILLRDQLAAALGSDVAEKVLREAIGDSIPPTGTPNTVVGADG